MSFQSSLTPNLNRLCGVRIGWVRLQAPKMSHVPGAEVRAAQRLFGRGLFRAPGAQMMNGYLQCACSASFQDLQL